ncbi:MAG TPA: hypothetical protein VJY65_02925 [Chloroflexota bacterium]|nr:hypothetical protein [Chloroflexota bacterium]
MATGKWTIERLPGQNVRTVKAHCDIPCGCICNWEITWEQRTHGRVQVGLHITKVRIHCHVHGDQKVWYEAVDRLEKAECCGRPLEHELGAGGYRCPECGNKVSGDYILYGPEVTLFDIEHST